jgi:hypothetical protein
MVFLDVACCPPPLLRPAFLEQDPTPSLSAHPRPCLRRRVSCGFLEPADGGASAAGSGWDPQCLLLRGNRHRSE